MDFKKLANILMIGGTSLIAIALLWWGRYYGPISNGHLKSALKCIYSTSGMCGVVDYIGGFATEFPYNPTLFWVGVVCLLFGFMLGMSTKK